MNYLHLRMKGLGAVGIWSIAHAAVLESGVNSNAFGCRCFTGYREYAVTKDPLNPANNIATLDPESLKLVFDPEPLHVLTREDIAWHAAQSHMYSLGYDSEHKRFGEFISIVATENILGMTTIERLQLHNEIINVPAKRIEWLHDANEYMKTVDPNLVIDYTKPPAPPRVKLYAHTYDNRSNPLAARSICVDVCTKEIPYGNHVYKRLMPSLGLSILDPSGQPSVESLHDSTPRIPIPQVLNLVDLQSNAIFEEPEYRHLIDNHYIKALDNEVAKYLHSMKSMWLKMQFMMIRYDPARRLVNPIFGTSVGDIISSYATHELLKMVPTTNMNLRWEMLGDVTRNFEVLIHPHETLFDNYSAILRDYHDIRSRELARRASVAAEAARDAGPEIVEVRNVDNQMLTAVKERMARHVYASPSAEELKSVKSFTTPAIHSPSKAGRVKNNDLVTETINSDEPSSSEQEVLTSSTVGLKDKPAEERTLEGEPINDSLQVTPHHQKP